MMLHRGSIYRTPASGSTGGAQRPIRATRLQAAALSSTVTHTQRDIIQHVSNIRQGVQHDESMASDSEPAAPPRRHLMRGALISPPPHGGHSAPGAAAAAGAGSSSMSAQTHPFRSLTHSTEHQHRPRQQHQHSADYDDDEDGPWPSSSSMPRLSRVALPPFTDHRGAPQRSSTSHHTQSAAPAAAASSSGRPPKAKAKNRDSMSVDGSDGDGDTDASVMIDVARAYNEPVVLTDQQVRESLQRNVPLPSGVPATIFSPERSSLYSLLFTSYKAIIVITNAKAEFVLLLALMWRIIHKFCTGNSKGDYDNESSKYMATHLVPALLAEAERNGIPTGGIFAHWQSYHPAAHKYFGDLELACAGREAATVQNAHRFWQGILELYSESRKNRSLLNHFKVLYPDQFRTAFKKLYATAEERRTQLMRVFKDEISATNFKNEVLRAAHPPPAAPAPLAANASSSSVAASAPPAVPAVPSDLDLRGDHAVGRLMAPPQDMELAEVDSEDDSGSELEFDEPEEAPKPKQRATGYKVQSRKNFSSATNQPSKKVKASRTVLEQEKRITNNKKLTIVPARYEPSQRAHKVPAKLAIAAAHAHGGFDKLPPESIVDKLLSVPSDDAILDALCEINRESTQISSLDRGALILLLRDFREALDHAGNRRVVVTGDATVQHSGCPTMHLPQLATLLEEHHLRAISIVMTPHPAWVFHQTLRFSMQNIFNPRSFSYVHGSFGGGLRCVSNVCLPVSLQAGEKEGRVSFVGADMDPMAPRANSMLTDRRVPVADSACVTGVSLDPEFVQFVDSAGLFEACVATRHQDGLAKMIDTRKTFIGAADRRYPSDRINFATVISHIELAREDLELTAFSVSDNAKLRADAEELLQQGNGASVFVYRAGPSEIKDKKGGVPLASDAKEFDIGHSKRDASILLMLSKNSFFNLKYLAKQQGSLQPDLWLADREYNFYPLVLDYLKVEQPEVYQAIEKDDVFNFLSKISIVPGGATLPFHSDSAVMLLPVWSHQVSGSSLVVTTPAVRDSVMLQQTMEVTVENACVRGRAAGDISDKNMPSCHPDYPTLADQDTGSKQYVDAGRIALLSGMVVSSLSDLAMRTPLAVVHVASGEVHLSAGGFNANMSIFPGPSTSVVFSSPCFDRRALKNVDAMLAYLQWLHDLADNDDLVNTMGRLRIPLKALAVCIKRMPGSMLCAWKHTWMQLPTVKAMETESVAWDAGTTLGRIELVLHKPKFAKFYKKHLSLSEQKVFMCKHMIDVAK